MPNIAVSKWVLAIALVAGVAQPAEARKRSGFGGMGRAEKIIGVRDLPDTETFRRDGAYWDLGLLYTERSVLGMTVSGSPDAGRPVLYHGDQYIEMTPELQAMLTATLGEDVVAAAKAGQAKAAEMKAEANAGGGGASREGAGLIAGFGMAGLSMLLVFGGLLFGARRIVRRLRGAASPAGEATRRPAETEADIAATDTDSFDRRVAARLAALREGSEPVTAAADAPVPALAAPRGFGRKGL